VGPSQLAALALSLGFLGAPLAPSSVRVLLVGVESDALSRQVRAEANHAGFVTEVTAPEPGDEAAFLKRHDAVAAIHLISAESVRIYVAASGEHSTYDARLRRAAADGDSFAVRIVEHVRGRLVEFELLPPEPLAAEAAPGSQAPPAAPPSATPAPAETPATGSARSAPAATAATRSSRDDGAAAPAPTVTNPWIWFSAGVAGTSAIGGLGPTLETALGMRLQPSPAWSASAFALLPLTENELSEPEGSADVSVHLFYGELAYSPFRLGAHGRFELGPGAGVVVLPMSGEAAPPHEGHTKQLVGGVFFAHVAAIWRPSSWLGLRASLRGGASAPRLLVRFDEHEVAAWGRAFAVATLDAQLAWPVSE
jgi:hypothetical protein